MHLSAEEVHARAQALLPEISVATVYNTLNELAAMGEVLAISTGDGPRRFDPNARVPHQHLLCACCGALRDVSPLGQEDLRLVDEERYGFRLLSVEIVFRGVCPECDAPPEGAAVTGRSPSA